MNLNREELYNFRKMLETPVGIQNLKEVLDVAISRWEIEEITDRISLGEPPDEIGDNP
jgi:hypothetical protein